MEQVFFILMAETVRKFRTVFSAWAEMMFWSLIIYVFFKNTY